MRVYEHLAKDIKDYGVTDVFGLVSDDTVMFATALDNLGVIFNGARHENTAIAMAEGYSAATGNLGVAVIGRGPAAANGTHGAVYSLRTGSSVLIIYGDAPSILPTVNAIGPDYKEFNAVGVLSAAGLQVFRATGAAGARSVLADAIEVAEKGRTVALLLPTNVQRAESNISDQRQGRAKKSIDSSPQKARSQAISVTTDILIKSRKPIIIAGFGAHRANAREVLKELADRIGALLATTARGKDLFIGYPYNIGIIGSFSHSLARKYIEEADCVLVFGASLNFWSTSFGTFLPDVPIIQIDQNRKNIGKNSSVELSLVGDARTVAQQIIDFLPTEYEQDKPFHSENTVKALDTFDISHDFQAMDSKRTLDPRSLGISLDKILPPKRNLVYDAGNFLGIVPYISVPGPGNFKFTNDFASIGLGFGAALGFSKGKPDHTTVLILGDGGLMMTLGELETVVRADIPLVIIVLNDCAYGAELHFLKMNQLPVSTSVFPDIDFAPIAEQLAFNALTIRSLEDLNKAKTYLHDLEEPLLLDCKINADIAAPFMGELATFENGEH